MHYWCGRRKTCGMQYICRCIFDMNYDFRHALDLGGRVPYLAGYNPIAMIGFGNYIFNDQWRRLSHRTQIFNRNREHKYSGRQDHYNGRCPH